MLNKLFEPARIGSLKLRNRIVMPPLVVNFANNSYVSEDNRAYYAERAKGGVGLIIVEATAIASGGRGSPLQLSIYNDDFIPGLRGLTEDIHRHGAKAAIQLVHVGRQGQSRFLGQQPVAPSPVPYAGAEVPRELRIEEIGQLVEDFAEAARRAKEAGFDAVEIHGAHGYLISEFLSPRVNKRSDKYGGDLRGRASFAAEIVRKTRSKVGSDFGILFRMNGDDYLPGGLTLGESCVIARILQEAGIDCIDVSAGSYEALDVFVQPASFPAGGLAHLAGAIKKAVDIPVIAVGRIGDPLLAENILQQGNADLIAMGRALIADPELPKKAKEGRLDEIRPCLACRQCLDGIFQKRKVTCAVNPSFGQEAKCALVPATKRKKVLVAGGGPSGLEAARIAALRGHEVVLYEREDRLGGQLTIASVPPYKQGISLLLKSLITQVSKLGVKIHLKCEVTPDLVREIRSDAVVVATGGGSSLPDIRGVQRSNVSLATDVLAGKKENIGERVVIIGGGQIGCETAHFLASLGKKVVVVARHDAAARMGPLERKHLLLKLHEIGVVIHTNAGVQEITDGGVQIRVNDQDVFLNAENVLIATGSKSRDELVQQLTGKIAELYFAGDCVKPRKLYDAILEGFQIGLKI